MTVMAGKSEPFAYERVCRVLTDLIRRGRLKAGDRLPSEQALARRFRCGYHTVRKGMTILEKQRVVERRVGSGTFVLAVPSDTDRPSFIARTRTNTRLTVGVLCPSKLDSFAAELLGHLHEQATRQEMSLILRTVTDFQEAARQTANELVEQECDAILVPWVPQPEPVNDIWHLVHSVNAPVVLSRPMPGLQANCHERLETFGQNEHVIIEAICRYFQRLNFGHIAFFGPDTQKIEGLGHRVLAYSRYTSNHGLDNLIGLVATGCEAVDRVVERWSKYKGDLAVICFDDDHAVRLMTAGHKLGLGIPDDIAVFGFNNTPMCENADPPLSTVQYDYDFAAQRLLGHVHHMLGQPRSPWTEKRKPPFVIRESCGGKRRGGENLPAILDECQSLANTLSEVKTL